MERVLAVGIQVDFMADVRNHPIKNRLGVDIGPVDDQNKGLMERD